ncbi:hypothetical protein D3C75_706620 [compost metagenome]
MGEGFGEDADIGMRQRNDSQLHTHPAYDDKSGDFQIGPGMQQLHKQVSRETHDDQSDKAAGENHQELSAVHSADPGKTAGGKRNGQRNCCQDGVDSKGDIRHLHLQHRHPEAGFFILHNNASGFFNFLVLEHQLPEDMIGGDKQQIQCADSLDLPDVHEKRNYK